MKKALFLLAAALTIFTITAKAQNKIGPVQRKMLDTLCNCMSKIDMTKIKTPDEAETAFSNCFNDHLDMLIDVAKEERLDFTIPEDQEKVGALIGQNLLQDKCAIFFKLAALMAKKDDEKTVQTESTTGTFKRIDLKGFNYIVIDDAGSQKSFLWLREFAGSDKFMGATTTLLNKKLKITWQEIEVYLPAAKGYYKVKEITAIDIL
jgi:hypothetical protein